VSQAAQSFIEKNKERFLEELFSFLRIPSVSTDPNHKADVARAAHFVAESLKAAGLENIEIIPTAKHPLVYADWMHAPGKPTVLCYGHYDVQPPDPLAEWKSPPFEPTLRDGNIYARGSADDKGQMYMHVKAVETLLQTGGGKLPVNVKFLIEGEEEVGGESVAKYVAENPAKLKADVALVSDTGVVRRRNSDLVRGIARAGVYGNRSAGSVARSAFGDLRRRGAQCGVRTG
jgi:acetylornithine deacetylase/succinyl-diaminopimelate desuccinylase-like protein